MARRIVNRSFWERTYRTLRYRYLRLILLPESPHRIGLGLAIGIFVGLTPTVGIQMPIAVAIALLLRGNKVAAALGVWVSNPITVPPLYALFFVIGRSITRFGHHIVMPRVWDLQAFFSIGWDAFLAMMAGGLVLALFFAPLTYFLTIRYIDRLQAWERAKIRRRR